MPDKLEKIYQGLISSGKTDEKKLGSYQDFIKKVDENLVGVYKELLNSGFTEKEVGNWAYFNTFMTGERTGVQRKTSGKVIITLPNGQTSEETTPNVAKPANNGTVQPNAVVPENITKDGTTKKPEIPQVDAGIPKLNTPTQSDLSSDQRSIRPDSFMQDELPKPIDPLEIREKPTRLTSKELNAIDKGFSATLYQHNLPNATEPKGMTEGEKNAKERREQASLQGAILSLEQQKQSMEWTGDDLQSYNPERVKIDKEIQAKREQLKSYKEPVDFFDRIPNSDKYAANKPEIQHYLKNMEIASPEVYKDLNKRAEKGLLTEQDYFTRVVNPALQTQMEIADQDYEILKERGVIEKAKTAATVMRDMEELQAAIQANPQDEQLKAEFMQKDAQLKSLQDPQIDELFNVIAKGESARQAYGEAILAIGKDIGLVPESETVPTDDMQKNIMSQLDENREARAGYGEGSLKVFAESVAGVMDDLDALGKFAAKHTGLGDILLPEGWEKRKGIAGQAAEELRDKIMPLEDMPDTWTGTMLSTAIPMGTLIAEMAMFPEIRSARLARATGGVVKAIPAFTTMEGTLGGVREWEKLVTDNPEERNIALETLKGTAEGAALGTGLHFLGAFGGETSKFVAKYVKGNFVPAATAFTTTGTAFGVLDAFEQYMTTGKVDLKQSTAVGVGASVLSAPHVMKALATDAYNKANQHYFSASKEIIQKAQEMPAQPEELLKEAIEQKKHGNENEANVLNTMAYVKMAAEDVAAKPDKYKKEVQESPLTDKEKEFHLAKIDETVKFASDLRITEDRSITANQKRLGLPTEVSTPIADATGETLLKIEAGEPVVNSRIKEASKDLYERYKGLVSERNNHNRKFTTEQIDKAIDDLGGKIEKLETLLQKQGETGEFSGIVNPKPVEEVAEPAKEPASEPAKEAKPASEPVKQEPVEAPAKAETPVAEKPIPANEKASEPASDKPVEAEKPAATTPDFTQFETIAKSSKTAAEAFEKVSKIKGVPEETSKAFRDKYDPEGKLPPMQAFEKFYNEVSVADKETVEPSKEASQIAPMKIRGKMWEFTGEVRENGDHEFKSPEGETMWVAKSMVKPVEADRVPDVKKTIEPELPKTEKTKTGKAIEPETKVSANVSKMQLDELNTAIAKLKADNPNEFKKDGTLKANSKIAPALKSLSDKRAEAAERYANEFPELSKKQKEASRKETEAINKAFDERQKDLEKRTNTTKEEILEASIEDKLRFRQELSKEEIDYANENMFRPKGFDYGKDGLEPSKAIEPEPKPEPKTAKEPWEMTMKEYDELGKKYDQEQKSNELKKATPSNNVINEILDRVDSVGEAVISTNYESFGYELWFTVSKGKKKGIYNITDKYPNSSGFYRPEIFASNVDREGVVKFVNDRIKSILSRGTFQLPDQYSSIKQALSEGKPVPPEVLKDYPDLMPKSGTAKQTIPPKDDYDATGIDVLGMGQLKMWIPTQMLIGNWAEIRDLAIRSGVKMPRNQKEFERELKDKFGDKAISDFDANVNSLLHDKIKNYLESKATKEPTTIPDLQEALQRREITLDEYNKRVEELRKQPEQGFTHSTTPRPEVVETPVGITPSPIYGGKPQRWTKMLQELNKALSKAGLFGRVDFGSPSSKSRRGVYLPSSGAIRIRYAADIPAVTHELGHRIDDKYKVLETVQDGSLDAELSRLWVTGSNPPPNHPDPLKYQRSEGLAEFIRAYMLNPGEARRQFPGTYHLYETKVPEKVRQAMDKYSNNIREWWGLSDADKTGSNVVDYAEEASFWDKAIAPFVNTGEFRRTWWDATKEQWGSQYSFVKKAWNAVLKMKGIENVVASKDFIKRSRLLLGHNRKFQAVLEHGMIDAKFNILKDPKTGENMTWDWLIAPFHENARNYDQVIANKEYSEHVRMQRRALELVEKKQYAQVEADLKDLKKLPPQAILNKFPKLQAKYQAEITKFINDAVTNNVPSVDMYHADKRYDFTKDILTGFGGGMIQDYDLALNTVRDYEALKNTDKARYDMVEESDRRYRLMSDNVMKYMLDNERITQDAYDYIKEANNFYIAMKVVKDIDSGIHLESDGVGKKGQITSIDKSIIKKYEGSAYEKVNPYVALLETMDRAIKESDRNAALNTFVDPLRTTRGMSEGEVEFLADIAYKVDAAKGGETITVYNKGEAEHWRLNKDLYDAITKMNDASIDKFVRIATTPMRMLRQSVTTFPVFQARNRVRDFVSRLVVGQGSVSYKDFVNRKKAGIDLELAGGGQFGYYFHNKINYFDFMDNKIREMNRDKNNTILHPLKFAQKVGNTYMKLLGNSELQTRKEEYNSVYRQAKKNGMSEFDAKIEATFAERNLMDFGVQGKYMKVLNAIFPFTNARLRGFGVAMRAIRTRPLQTLGKFALYVAVPEALHALMISESDEETQKKYYQLPPWRRDMFWNIPAGDGWVSIPKPFEFGLVASVFRRVYDHAAGDKTAFSPEVTKFLAENILPINPQMFTGSNPLFDILYGRDSYRNKDIIPWYEKNVAVSEREGTVRASNLGQDLQALSGDNVDARSIDFAIRTLFTYPGTWALKFSDIGRDDKENKINLDLTGFYTTDQPAFSKDVLWVNDQVKKYNINVVKAIKATPTAEYLKTLNQDQRNYFKTISELRYLKEFQDFQSAYSDYWKADEKDRPALEKKMVDDAIMLRQKYGDKDIPKDMRRYKALRPKKDK
jgi:hypothetical protein